MKRTLLAVMSVAAIALSGCGSPSSLAEQTVKGMLGNLYFKQGTYDEYRNYFQNPTHAASQTQYDTIRSVGAKVVFPKAKTIDDVAKQLRGFRKDDNTYVVYWTDFTLDKTRDMHWNVIKTDKGWEIQN